MKKNGYGRVSLPPGVVAPERMRNLQGGEVLSVAKD
jgi:hypothetical protein